MKNVAFKVVGDWLLAVYSENPPSEEEARLILKAFKSMDLDKMRMLVFTKGGAPTTAQRRDLNDVLRGRTFPTAVVSDAVMVRGVVTAMSWFNSAIKVFPLSATDDALRYIGIPETQYEFMRREIAKLQAELNKPGMKRAAS
jgi:hypothetical protein